MNDKEIKYDGYLHPMNDKRAYISQKLTESEAHELTSGVNGIKFEFLKKIADYVIEMDRDKAVEWLGRAIWDNRELDIEFIFKPAHMVSILAQYSTVSVIIDRLEDDEDFFHDEESLTSCAPFSFPNRVQLSGPSQPLTVSTCSEGNECKAVLHDEINHPTHYQGKNGFETIDVIENFDLNFRLANVFKYISRADKKGDRVKDLEKALWYLTREVERAKIDRQNQTPLRGA